MAATKVYIFKIASRKSLAELGVILESHGTVLSMREHIEGEAVAVKPARTQPPRGQEFSDKVKEKQRELDSAHLEKVSTDLAPILVANPHAPLSMIVNKLNETGAKNRRGNAFTESNVQRYVTYALEKMTKPDTSNRKPHSTPPG